MKVCVAVILLGIAYCVLAERCDNVTTCTGTICAATADHVHLECVERHCTCSKDPKPCLQSGDCGVGTKCIDRDGHTTTFHCLDGKCFCIRI